MKDNSNSVSRVRWTSNISSAVFIAYMAYAINGWHRLGGFDNFMNVLVMALILAVNIKFYIIYWNLSSQEGTLENSSVHDILRRSKNEYQQLMKASLWMMGILLIIKFVLK